MFESVTGEALRTHRQSGDQVEVGIPVGGSLEEVHYILLGMLVEAPKTIVRPWERKKVNKQFYLRVVSTLSLWRTWNTSV